MTMPPMPEPTRSVPPAQEVRIQPVFIRTPETTRETYVERTFVEQLAPVTQPVERHTDALPVLTPPPAQVIVITQPERTRDEPPVREQGQAIDDTRNPSGTRTNVPTPEVPPTPPVSELPAVAPKLEAGTSTQPEQTEVTPEPGTSARAQPEEKTSERKKKLPPEVPQSSEPGTSADKLKVYSGKGRRHSDEQIDEILDEYLQYGNLPKYVTERQRRDYRKHKRLELRRLYLEQAGLIIHGIEPGH